LTDFLRHPKYPRAAGHSAWILHDRRRARGL